MHKGGPDPAANFHLDAMIRRAHRANVSKQVIDKAIQTGSGDHASGATLEEVLYEGVGAGGALFVVDALTDNRKRTAPVIRHLFSKYGGSIGAGCSMFNFDMSGFMEVSVQEAFQMDGVMEVAIECGADDFVTSEEQLKVNIFCNPSDLESVSKALTKSGLEVHSESIVRKPKSYFETEDMDILAKLSDLEQALEEVDDVQAVYHNIQ